MVNQSTLNNIQTFLCTPSKAEYLLPVPALYNLVQVSFADVPAISAWVAKRAQEVLMSLQSHDALGTDSSIIPSSWIKVSEKSEFLRILRLTHSSRQAACIACRKYDIDPFIKILNTIRRERSQVVATRNAVNILLSMVSSGLLAEYWLRGAHTVSVTASTAFPKAKDATTYFRQ